MKRVRKAAIVESSGSEEDSDDSDFGETLRDKLKRKRLEAGNSNVEKEKSKEDEQKAKKMKKKPIVKQTAIVKTLYMFGKFNNSIQMLLNLFTCKAGGLRRAEGA